MLGLDVSLDSRSGDWVSIEIEVVSKSGNVESTVSVSIDAVSSSSNVVFIQNKATAQKTTIGCLDRESNHEFELSGDG